MTYTPEKIAAYAALDEAVDKLREAYAKEDDDPDESVLTGYVLVTSSIVFEKQQDDPKWDDLDTSALCGIYSRRGQDPTLTCGIINEAVRKYNEVQINHNLGDDE